MNDKFSIIVPTMWIPEKFTEAIKKYLKSSLVQEIIIIDNNPSQRPILPKDDRIKILTKGYNIFVNPAWNWGVQTSKMENLIILNDDLVIENIEDILIELQKTCFDFVGLDFENLNKENKVQITKKEKGLTKGFGCFMFIRKKNYHYIPDNLRIWYGDNILFSKNTNIGKISFDNVEISLSKTIKKVIGSIEIIETDKKNYNEYRN